MNVECSTRVKPFTGGHIDGEIWIELFKPTEKFNGNWSILESKSREWEKMYRERWSHDKVVRTTHGVNCTGSCSWKVL